MLLIDNKIIKSKVRLFFSLVFAVFFLTSCSFIIKDISIPIEHEFEKNSEYIKFKRPKIRISDSRYNQKLSNYWIADAFVSSTSKTQRSKDAYMEPENLLNFLFLTDKLFVAKEEFILKSNQSFSFSLRNNNDVKMRSECQLNTLSISKETKEKPSGKWSANDDYHKRLITSLVCKISNNNEVWNLVLDSKIGKKVEISLKNEKQTFEMKPISKGYGFTKDKSGLVRHELEYPRSAYTGLSFYYREKQLSAISFIGEPQMWISQNVDSQMRELLLSANYTLMMFNWFGSGWRTANYDSL